MRRGRPRLYPDNAARQRAYRQRQAQPSPAALLGQSCATPDPDETWEAFISRVGVALSAVERQRDVLQWTTAQLIVAADRGARRHPARPRCRPAHISRLVLNAVRVWADQAQVAVPRPTVLKTALQMAETFPDLFAESDIS
jgi:hypothetical protein